jgi:hypothetical protein
MIPDGARTVFAHEAQPEAAETGSPITVEQMLAHARAAAPAPAPPANGGQGAIAVERPPTAAGRTPPEAPSGMASLPKMEGNAVVLALTAEGSGDLDEAARARLDAAMRRLPEGMALRARIAIGPVVSGEPVAGLAHAQRLARTVAGGLPERVQPARLVYRPDLRPGELVVDFTPAGTPTDG